MYLPISLGGIVVVVLVLWLLVLCPVNKFTKASKLFED